MIHWIYCKTIMVDATNVYPPSGCKFLCLSRYIPAMFGQCWQYSRDVSVVSTLLVSFGCLSYEVMTRSYQIVMDPSIHPSIHPGPKSQQPWQVPWRCTCSQAQGQRRGVSSANRARCPLTQAVLRVVFKK